MNSKQLDKIFENYINRFDLINDEAHREYYKWQICDQFPGLMKTALSTDDTNFAKALNEVKKCTQNVIDSQIQPFWGLVKIAEDQPAEVKRLLTNLYFEDGGDLKIRMEKIADFFAKSDELRKAEFGENYRYKQNSHSVSALLFLNDPDHHYMYKATHCQRFADYIEFYDDWGTGDNIKLDVFHRMCDEVVDAIKNNTELLKVDQSRYDGRLAIEGSLHPDNEKHILAFDIMYCSGAYDLFEGITCSKLSSKEKQLYLANKIKAEKLLQAYKKAEADAINLEKALSILSKMIKPGDIIKHVRYGEGKVIKVEGKNFTVDFGEKRRQLSLPVTIGNGIVTIDRTGFADMVSQYASVLKKHDSISDWFKNAERNLEPYLRYLD